MPLLLKRTEMANLLTEPATIEESFEVIRQAMLGSATVSEHTSWLAYPLGASSNRLLFNLINSPAGTVLRTLPEPSTELASISTTLAQLYNEKGQLEALLDFQDLGRWRTSGVAAFAARALAPSNSRVAAVIGSGVEARYYVRGLVVALPQLEEIRVYSRTAQNRERFAQEMATDQIKVVPVEQAQAAVEGADVIYVAAASHGQQAFQASWVKPGALVSSIIFGVFPSDLKGRRVTPDRDAPEQRATGWEPWPLNNQQRAGEEVLSWAEVLRGTPARRSPDETLLYLQAGVFAWDVPLLQWAYQKALEKGWGTTFEFDS